MGIRILFPAAVASAVAAVMLIAGCLKPDQAALTSNALVPPANPDCASCHAYPLHDVNHVYHLTSMNTREGVQAKFIYERKTGAIVCMDCHFGSIAHRSYSWYDTLWGTAGDVHGSADKQPGDPIYRIDSIPGFLPIPAGFSAASFTADKFDSITQAASRIGGIVAWLTSARHLNGRVDVEFSPSIVPDSGLASLAYRAKDMSCSNIECHNAPKKTYRWASKRLGLPGCPSLAHSSSLDSSCGYSRSQEPN